MDKAIEKINYFNWHDWTVNEIKVSFEDIHVKVSFNEKVFLTLKCINHIGINYTGHWDESTIDDMMIIKFGDFVSESLIIVKSLNDEAFLGNGSKDIKDDFYQLNIVLIDGVVIKIGFKEFLIEENQIIDN